jgi:hypothetical protein
MHIASARFSLACGSLVQNPLRGQSPLRRFSVGAMEFVVT